MDATSPGTLVAAPAAGLSSPVKSAGKRVEAGSRACLTPEEILDRIEVPADLHSILARGGHWSQSDLDRVFGWITNGNGPVFQSMLGLVKKWSYLTLEQVGINSDSATTFDEVDEALEFAKALDQEAADLLRDFLKQLPDVVGSFDPTLSASFLIHLCARLRSFLGLELPTEVQSTLLEGKRTDAGIDLVVRWIGKHWRARLLGIAPRYLGHFATHSDAEDAVQTFFASRPRQGKATTCAADQTTVEAEAVQVVRKFDAAKGKLWSYLRVSFIRSCGKRRKEIEKIQNFEKPVQTAGGSDAEEIEIDLLEDPNGIPPDQQVELKELKEELKELCRTVRNCLRKLRQKYYLVIDSLWFKGLTVKETAKALNLSQSNVKVIHWRAFRLLSKMPELRALKIVAH